MWQHGKRRDEARMRAPCLDTGVSPVEEMHGVKVKEGSGALTPVSAPAPVEGRLFCSWLFPDGVSPISTACCGVWDAVGVASTQFLGIPK